VKFVAAGKPHDTGDIGDVVFEADDAFKGGGGDILRG